MPNRGRAKGLLGRAPKAILVPNTLISRGYCWGHAIGSSERRQVDSNEVAGKAGGGSRTPQAELARKLNLLLDIVVADRGTPFTYREVSEALTKRGVSLSRARWFYMKDGTGRMVSDPELLTALSELFEVDPSYLLGSEGAEVPERIDAQLEFVKSLRAARVKTFAARTLGDVSPETLRAITEYLNEDIALHPAGESSAASGSEGSPDGQPEEP